MIQKIIQKIIIYSLMSQSPYSNGKRNQTYSSPTFQSSVFLTPIILDKQSTNKKQTPPPYAIYLGTPVTNDQELRRSMSPQPPPFAINFDTKIDMDLKKKRCQKRHFLHSHQQSQQQTLNDSNFSNRKFQGYKDLKSSLFIQSTTQNTPLRFYNQTNRSIIRTEQNVDSNKPYQEQLFLETRNLEEFQKRMHKKIDSLNNTFQYEQKLLNKENIDTMPDNLTTRLRTLTSQFDDIDKQYDHDLMKLSKEKKTLYSQQLIQAIESSREKQSTKNDRNQRKRQLLEELQKIEQTKRELVDDYSKLKKNYLNRSLHMQKNHLAQISQIQDQKYLLRQVNELESINKKKEEQNRKTISQFHQMLNEPIRAVKPRSYDCRLFT